MCTLRAQLDRAHFAGGPPQTVQLFNCFLATKLENNFPKSQVLHQFGSRILIEMVVFMVCKVMYPETTLMANSQRAKAPAAQCTLSSRCLKHHKRAEDLLVWPAVCSRWRPELQPSVFGWLRRGWLLFSGIYDGRSCYTLHRKYSSTAVYHVIKICHWEHSLVSVMSLTVPPYAFHIIYLWCNSAFLKGKLKLHKEH